MARNADDYLVIAMVAAIFVIAPIILIFGTVF